MLEGKLIIIPALGHQNKGMSRFTGSGLFVLMSQCRNNNELALQHGQILYHIIVCCKRPTIPVEAGLSLENAVITYKFNSTSVLHILIEHANDLSKLTAR